MTDWLTMKYLIPILLLLSTSFIQAEPIVGGYGGEIVSTNGDVSLTQSNTVLENITGMSVSLGVGTYAVDAFCITTNSNAAASKFGVNFSGTCSANYESKVGANRFIGASSALSNADLGNATTGVAISYQTTLKIVVTVSGTLQFKAAQNASEATAITANGYAIVTKIP